jgi:type I restriction enzyme S subunit
LLEYVKRKSFYEKLGETADGSRKARRIHADTFLSFPILVPQIKEQQKIADCLASLDYLITAETQKLAALKTHKKGLMQQLFPAEGDTVPRLRFPEFRDAGEWEEKTLKSFCKVGDIDHKMPSSVDDGIPYIMTGDFFGINNIDFDNAKKISADDYEQLSRKIKPEFGDIIIARYASVGAVRYIETKIKFLVSYSCAIIKCNKPESSKYLYYIFQSDSIQSKIGLEINMSSQKNIGIDSIKNLNIFLPTLTEQQKIADCLSSVDALITAQGEKIEALKLHKKGLMQQLFPVMEAVDA